MASCRSCRQKHVTSVECGLCIPPACEAEADATQNVEAEADATHNVKAMPSCWGLGCPTAHYERAPYNWLSYDLWLTTRMRTTRMHEN